MQIADEITVTLGARSNTGRNEFIRIVDGIALVPTEHVLLLRARLPLNSDRRRRDALPFALEDQVSQPLDTLHFALGECLDPGEYLCAALAQDRMRLWHDAIGQAEHRIVGMMPDALSLPVPAARHWAVEIRHGRALIRHSDGTGFAVDTGNLAQIWSLGGSPPLLVAGDTPPDDVPVAGPLMLAPISERVKHCPLDLCQGGFAIRRPALNPHWRRAAVITLCGLAAHGVISAADTFALTRLAQAHRAETETMVALARPGAYLGGDLVETATALLPEGDAPPPTFLPLMTRVAGVLAPLAPALRFETVDFAGTEGELKLTITATDARTLDAVAGRLRAAGMQTHANTPMRAATGMRGEMRIRNTI